MEPILHGTRPLWAVLVTTAYLALCLGLAWRHHWRQATRQATPQDWLIAYASQSGSTARLAQQTLNTLQTGGQTARLLALNQVQEADLSQATRLLLLVSTYGEGEAPDNAARFAARVLPGCLPLPGLDYALLALGDRQYPQFCGFAQRLGQWLDTQGARALFPLLEVDRQSPDALRRWQQQLANLTGKAAEQDWILPDYQPWQLCERRLLNPGSPGAPLYWLRLENQQPSASWQAGDLVEVGPGNAPDQLDPLLAATPSARPWRQQLQRRQLPDSLQGLDLHSLEQLPYLAQRTYSIANHDTSNGLELLVRLARQADGKPGLGSGWLCLHARLGEPIDLRITHNPGFHQLDDTRPLILIGNGSGLAGLRAHLQRREALGRSRNWLLYGERTRQYDQPFQHELSRWLASGHLSRLDLAFSREPDAPCYVQDRLRAAADELHTWLDEGAQLLVCGSRKGMGEEVDAILHGLLGQQRLEQLQHSGRYRRDVY